MQISPIPTLSDDINDIRTRTANIVAEKIIPNEREIYSKSENSASVRKEIRDQVKKEKLWAPHLPEEYGGMGIDEWVINGHKVMTSNGIKADFAIVMCRTEEEGEDGEVNSRMTQIIVPTDTPGFNVIRSVPIWGHTGGDHVEIKYENVRVPVENQLGARGTGHAAAQDRLGAGRVFHCMNSIGQMWRAFDLMLQRTITREVHGGKLETKQLIQGFIADSYIDIQTARLMTIHCAEVMDSENDPRVDISAIKIYVPEAMHRVVDRAIQVYGWKGVSADLPLFGMYQGARTLRLADGPDEVHRILIAKQVLKKYHQGLSWDFGI